MKLLCEHERLREGLALVNGVIPSKSTRPAIENVNLVAKDGSLELVGTDLEVALRLTIDDVKVGEPGTVLVGGRVCSDFVRDLTGDTVSIETQGDNLVLSSGSDRCQLLTADPDEFPVVARFDEKDSLEIQGGVFQRLVARTAFAAAKEQGRYAMHGILVLVEDETLKMVATDGRRLAVSSAPIATDGGQPRRAIVPTKAMQAFQRVVTDPLEKISLHFGDNQLGLRTKRAEIFARLIDGEFPRYSAVIPKETAHLLEADAEQLAKKLKLVSNVTSTDARAVRLSLDTGRLELFGRSAASGQATSAMDVDFKGDKCDIAFNPDFLLEGLRACESDVVRLEFNDRTSPGKFTLGENYVYVVMPITVDV
ncbi:MAG: DNA polymerase III subunit beta [Planctomycetota bacterium]